jgi:hypothetical protein
MATERERLRVTAKGGGRARMLVAALIGAMLLNPPLLEIFSTATGSRPFGWPLIILYINLIWLLLIVLVVYPKVWRLLREAWRSRAGAMHKGRD